MTPVPFKIRAGKRVRRPFSWEILNVGLDLMQIGNNLLPEVVLYCGKCVYQTGLGSYLTCAQCQKHLLQNSRW